jgi:hypothetical protein
VRTDVLQDLTDDPLQLDWQKRRSPWGAPALALLTAGAGLAGQYIAYHFDELARQDQYRPWFQQLCPQIGCTVPSKVDIAKSKAATWWCAAIRNSTARWWSTRSSTTARLLPAIPAAGAALCRPQWPSDRQPSLQARRIPQRRPGGHGEMPPQTPIHIALDILDPGPKR